MKAPLLLVIMLTALQALSQQTIVAHDDFSSNALHWDLDSHKSIDNGVLMVNAAAEGDETVVNFFIDPAMDYTVTADFTQKAGPEEGAFGLTWGTGEEDYNLFLISLAGDFAAYSGNPAHLKGWKRSSGIKPMHQTNTLKVEKHADKISFYINEAKVDEQKPFAIHGNWIGFVMFDEVQIAIDNFKIIQDQVIALAAKPSAHKKENLGGAVNSPEDDLGPMISSDGRTLYFARQNVRGNVGGFADEEDVWFSRYDFDRWTAAQNMGASVNTEKADNLVAISADNNTMMFVEENQLAVRHRSETGWSPLEKLNLSFKNESGYFVACMSADGKAILFSAKLISNVYYNKKRDECDLYICLRKNDNQWSDPINLGKTINTPGNETSPFLSADGTTLYFATDGRPGYGDQDIFFATRTGSGWTEWTTPVNLGPSVNTPGFEAYYTLPASGEYAYFVSNDANRKADIWRIRLQEDAKPRPVTLVAGSILAKGSGKPLTARIHFENLSTGSEVGEARSDPKTGAYQIVLPSGVNYGIRASVTGYYSLHENLDLTKSVAYSEVKKDLMMAPFNIGESIKLNNIFFEAGLANLKSESYHELDRLVTILKQNQNIHIELEGHTDNKGSASVLMKLSQDRVESVKEYLVTHGIDRNRITGKGYGATRPVAPSDSEENSSLNRRVEFKITRI